MGESAEGPVSVGRLFLRRACGCCEALACFEACAAWRWLKGMDGWMDVLYRRLPQNHSDPAEWTLLQILESESDEVDAARGRQ